MVNDRRYPQRVGKQRIPGGRVGRLDLGSQLRWIIENERGAVYRKFYVFLKLRIYNSTDSDTTTRRASNAAQKVFWRGTVYVSKGYH